MPDRKREGQNFKSRTLLKRIQKELKGTVGFDPSPKLETFLGSKIDQNTASPVGMLTSGVRAGFNAAKRKATGQESRKSLLLKEKKLKHMIDDLKAIDSKVYMTEDGEKDSRGRPVKEGSRKYDTRTNASPQTIKNSRRKERERFMNGGCVMAGRGVKKTKMG
jgi:hypothetical protein